MSRGNQSRFFKRVKVGRLIKTSEIKSMVVHIELSEIHMSLYPANPLTAPKPRSQPLFSGLYCERTTFSLGSIQHPLP